MKKIKYLLPLITLCIVGIVCFILYFTQPSAAVDSNLTDIKELESKLHASTELNTELSQKLSALDKKYNDMEANYNKLNDRVTFIVQNGDIALEQRVNLAQHSIKRLEDLINKTLGLKKIAGSITNLTKISDTTYVVIIEDAYDKRKTYELQLSKTCVPFFISEIGLVQSRYEDLIEKISIDLKQDFMDTYTFILIDDKIEQVYQGTELMNEVSRTSSYNKIYDYLEKESRLAFSPYYKLLSFEISDYEESVVDGLTEAIFSYKLIHKYYNKDPDTVGYIKEAKEKGNENYQQMYDEYLQPKEMNFHLKVTIDDQGTFTLYSNDSPIDIQWGEAKMSDFILKD